jgi:hypothetical protein
MKTRSCITLFLLLVMAAYAQQAIADDGANQNGTPGSRFDRSMSDGLPFGEHAGHAALDIMDRYIPAQRIDGTVLGDVPRYNIDGVQVETYSHARPQLGAFTYGPVDEAELEGIGFAGHGKRDAYISVTFDDGLTWKETNLSESADLSSADFDREDVALYAGDGINYPGDVIEVVHATAGDYVLAAWFSRYCDGGEPAYTLESSDPDRRDAIAAYMGIDLADPSPDDIYLLDMFLVAGSQGSVDYAQDQFEQNHQVGEVPYNCLWTARGSLEALDADGNVLPRDEETGEPVGTPVNWDIIWRKAERLTSGRRDVNRIEIAMVEGAGAVMTWQEDPEGLRAGQGLGPGEGWSGASANSQTDIWYSYVEWEHFAPVQQASDPLAIAELAAFDGETQPKPGVPFAVPMRLTDNAPCNPTNPAPYCNGSALADDTLLNPLDYGLRDMCAQIANATVRIGQDLRVSNNVCVTEDGLPLVANTASTRARINLFGYDSTGDGEHDSAWVVMQTEESKGLGKFGVSTITGDVGCDPEVDADCEVFDNGKNVWYHTFSMSLNDTGVEDSAALIENLAFHGNLMNQPEVDWQSGEFLPVTSTANLWNFDTGNFDIYRTEIARRGSLLAQPVSAVADGGFLSELIFADGFEDPAQAGEPDEPAIRESIDPANPLVAFPTWKQGALSQGGPADIMARRILLPDDWDITTGGIRNPYAFTNMACENWAYADGSNPFYPDGVCLDTAINLSSVTPDVCIDTANGSETACPSVDLTQGTFGVGDTNPILQGSEVEDPNTTKVLTWHQCQPGMSAGVVSDAGFPLSGDASFSCEDGAANRENNLADLSWFNPLDVAKGHRGFLDGDFVMVLYAWAPNWKLNARGQDRYQLYIRRSFDGGQTWTTLPSDYVHAGNDSAYTGVGTVHCEIFRSGGSLAEEPVGCYGYGAGEPEMARNISQLKSQAFTILDPRYAPTAGSLPGPDGEPIERDPSVYFAVYETGDNSTVAVGEAEPLNLYYSRAIRFGDEYTAWAEDSDLSVCYPNDLHGVTVTTNYDLAVPASGFCNEFDELEGQQGIASGEASLQTTPEGAWLYGAWTQENELTGESSAQWRKVWFIPDYISDTYSWTLPGTSSN